MSRDVNFSVTPDQAEFLKLDCAFPAFIAGYGSGKSHIMAINGFMDATHSSDAIVAFYEPTHDHLKTIIIPKIEGLLVDHGIRYALNKQDGTIMTSNSQIGDFMFKSMDNPSMIVGYEFYRAHIDELDTLPQDKAEEVWHKVIARNRQRPRGIEDVKNRISIYSTPEGYRFCYKMWGKKDNQRYQMVQAKTRSNPYASQEFIDSLLDMYTEEQAEAYLNGQFCNMTSSTVYSNYNRKIHDSTETIKDSDTLYVGCDFNVDHQAATIYVKRNGGQQWHAVKELCEMKDTPEMIRILQEQWHSKGHKIIIYPDASGAARKSTNASTSDIAELRLAGFEVRAHKKNPDVRDRIQATQKAFGSGVLFINSTTCPTVARCLEQQSYDKNGEPDKKSGNDHQNDATTYPIAYELPIRRPLFKLDFSFVT